MEIRVYASLKTFADNRPLYVRSIVSDGSIETDYSLLLRSMRVLYGNSCVVVFVCVS